MTIVAVFGDCRQIRQMLPNSATVLPFSATVAEFGDYSRQCAQGLTERDMRGIEISRHCVVMIYSMNGAVIVERIKDTRAPFYRPEPSQEESAGLPPDIWSLMKCCWAEDPAERPSFFDVARILRTINKGKSVSHCFAGSNNIVQCSPQCQERKVGT